MLSWLALSCFFVVVVCCLVLNCLVGVDLLLFRFVCIGLMLVLCFVVLSCIVSCCVV